MARVQGTHFSKQCLVLTTITAGILFANYKNLPQKLDGEFRQMIS